MNFQVVTQNFHRWPFIALIFFYYTLMLFTAFIIINASSMWTLSLIFADTRRSTSCQKKTRLPPLGFCLIFLIYYVLDAIWFVKRTFTIRFSAFNLWLVVVSVWILALPSPGICTHIFDAVFCFPAKLFLCFFRCTVAFCDIARSSRFDLVFDRMSACFFECMYNLQNAVAVSGT